MKKEKRTITASLAVLALGAAVLIGLLHPGTGWAGELETLADQGRTKYERFETEVRDLSVLQEARANTPQGESVAQIKAIKKGRRVRVESQIRTPTGGNMNTVAISDGKEAWLLGGTQKQSIPPADVEQLQAWSQWWRAMIEGGRIAGREKIGGRDCLVVEVAGRKIPPFTKLWIDPQALVAVQAEGPDRQGRPALVKFSDFKEIGAGYAIAYRTETSMGGQIHSSVVVKSVEVNKGLSDDLFDLSKVK